MSSPLQNATMKFLAEFVGARRVLEIGCYTGYSALAWDEATEKNKAEIITLELDPKMIAASRETFNKYSLNDRVKLVEGPADESLKKLTGQFDLVFVDANKEGYEGCAKYILDNKLLSSTGLIMCGNGESLIAALANLVGQPALTAVTVFARGMTISTEENPQLPAKVRPYWTENGKAPRKFCDFYKDDERVDVVLLPLFGGVT
ncbi:hypothetical protein ANO14919_091850 [Xylariales sp. No.14919]|nr:hypothetical protein ANO14919_091850 [Xylariales sp. No.14919]